MKIINVVQDFNTGGIQKLLIEYLRYFKDDKTVDYSVVVLEKPKNNIFDQICENEKLKIHYLNCELSKNKHYYIRKIQNWWSYNIRLFKYLKSEHPDIVHTHNTRIFARIEWCIKQLHSKFKWFHTLHSDPYAVNDAHVPIAQKMFFRYGVWPICLNKTQFEKAKQRYGIASCSFLFNCFDQKALTKSVIPSTQIRKELKISNDVLLVGCVGRNAPVKNYPFFVDVMSEVVKLHPNSIGIIVGDMSNSLDLKMKIQKSRLEKNIKLIDTRHDIQNIYNCLDRFVMVSTSESSPFVLLEAQLFDKYCIISDCVPNESICLDDKVVMLSLGSGHKKWAKEIVSPSEFAKKQHELSDFSLDKCSEKLLSIYNKHII